MLNHANPSARLRAALHIGTYPDAQVIDELIERCGVEPDFNVRETLTWALTRHDASVTVPKLVEQVRRGGNQSRSQALHTLSKIKDPQAWPVITAELLADSDDEVARSAWRAAVVLVPEGAEAELAQALATQLGRGDRAVHLSLSRALVFLGDVILPYLRASRAVAHAEATGRLLDDPDAAFELSALEAKRVDALGS